MIRVYEALNLGYILGLFSGFFQIFLVFSVSDFGIFFGFCGFLGILGLFGDFWTFLEILGLFFGIFVRVYEDFLSCEPLGKDTNDAVGSFNDYHSSSSNKLKSNQ